MTFNADETVLSTLCHQTVPVWAKTGSKARLTVMLCTNATGSYKMRPYVIGKAERPRCFGKTFKTSGLSTKITRRRGKPLLPSMNGC